MTKCINQLIRPKEKIPSWLFENGMGDCSTCKPCERNKKCSGYTPVGLIEFEVEEVKKHET